MNTGSMPPVIAWAILFGLLFGLAAWSIARRIDSTGSRRSGWWTTVAVLPAAGFIVAYFSLAWHMHHALGRWPATIGTVGFPERLIAHGDLALGYFGWFLVGSVVFWPVAFAASLAIRRLRCALAPLGTYAIAFAASLAAMAIAPPQFVYWWWD